MNRIQRERRPSPDATREFERIVGLALLFRRAERLSGPGDADGIGVLSMLSWVLQAQRGSGEKS
jgi:hypothetical protein